MEIRYIRNSSGWMVVTEGGLLAAAEFSHDARKGETVDQHVARTLAEMVSNPRRTANKDAAYYPGGVLYTDADITPDALSSLYSRHKRLPDT